jgi:hypothetical protein
MNPSSLFDLANIAVAGFSAISAVLLLLAYALLISVPGKSIYSVATYGAAAPLSWSSTTASTLRPLTPTSEWARATSSITVD